MGKKEIEPYVGLLELFLNNQIAAVDFQKDFFEIHSREEAFWSDDEYPVITKLCTDVDEFCADPTLRDERNLDEKQLREECQIAFEKLKALEKR